MKISLALLSCGVAFGLATASSSAGTVNFSDGTFSPADYDTAFVYQGDPANTATFSQCANCGDPSGTAMQLSLTEPNGAGGAAIGMINTTFTYNPSTQGTITSISASVDKQFFNPFTVSNNVTFGNNFRPLIEQGGEFYAAAINDGFVFTSGLSDYRAMSDPDLTAANFVQYDPSTGLFGSAHPDFAGGLMLFGLMQSVGPTVLATPSPILANYDNLGIGITSGVPEPSTWALALLGFAGLGFVGYRNTKSRQSALSA
jgi:PEP-CTERM motif